LKRRSKPKIIGQTGKDLEVHALTQDKLVVIGEVTKPHGVRGEFCVMSHADSPVLYSPGRRLGLRSPGESRRGSPGRDLPARWVTVLSSRPHQGRMLLTVQGVADRDAADALRGLEVVVPAGDLPPLDQGEVYLHELVGFDAVLPDGVKVGVLKGFLDVPGQDVWIIRAEDGKEILLPAHEATVPKIDMDARRITIDPPPGLLDL
jgi:16S rRNA processing protein RimM